MRPVSFVADDYALSASVNRGIESLARLGRIQGVSVMAHRDADLSTVGELLGTKAELGLHLVFVEERPLVPSRAWARFGGRLPKTHRDLFAHVLRDPSLLSALVEEAEAQLAAARAARIPVRFFNSHQHTHLFPPIWRALAPMFRRERLAVRATRKVHPTRPWKQLAVEASSALCCAVWPALGCDERAPIGIDVAGRFDVRAATRWAKRVDAGERAEFVVHPGHEDARLRARYGHWNYRWEQELAVLTSGEAHAVLGIDSGD